MGTEPPWWQKIVAPPDPAVGATLAPQVLDSPPTWIVSGGVESGGLIVRAGRELSSTQADARLCTGAVLKELGLVGERLHFQKIEGSGPDQGWVSVKVNGKDVLTRSSTEYSQAWTVVGGTETGILVRVGKELASEALSSRLQNGALVQELEIVGERLHYHRLTGLGPEHGWVSIKMKGKDLLVRSPRAYGPPHPVRNPMGGCGQPPVRAHGSVSVARSVATYQHPQPTRIDNEKIRVLCLCGGGSNNPIMKFQSAMLRGLLKEAEWDYMEGDILFDEARHTPRSVYPMADTIRKGAPYKLWYRQSFEPEYLGWTERELYFQPDVKVRYENGDEIISKVKRYVEDNGPYDVLLGFSFGATVLTLVSGAILHEGGELPWRLNLMFNGHHVRDDSYQRFFDAPLDCPSCIVCACNDHYREYEKCDTSDTGCSFEQSKLVQMYRNPTIITHDGWHDLPTGPPQAPQVYAEVVAAVRWHCGFAKA